MLKIVVLFLMLMLIISMVGNVVTKFFAPPKPPEEPKAQTRSKCSNCGRVVVGTAPCICGKG
jgi:Na+-transporting methylmalonyl-CoA/oxaloacetate decarboxylase gamma subunit